MSKTVAHRGTKNNQSLGRALLILEKMASYKRQVKLQTLADDLHLSPSTVLRFINTFIDQGYVAKDPETSHYFLTLKLAYLGETVKAAFPLRDIIKPFLIDIVSKFGESACMAVEQEFRVVYLDSVEGPGNTLKTLQRIGRVAPMNSTGVGKALLLNYYPDKLDVYFSSVTLERLTEKSIIDETRLREELSYVVQRGYALDDEECEKGVRCVAVPVRDFTGAVTAAVSVTGLLSTMTDTRIREIYAYLIERQGEMERLLARKGAG